MIRTRKITVPETTVALLTQTSKMPGPSWSLPAHKSCPRESGSICDSCYAGKGCYVWSTVANAQWERFNWTVGAMRTSEGRKEWIWTMIQAIDETGCEYFRVHDSGDIFNPQYAEAWYEVCRLMPEVKFWIPTRAYQSGKSQSILQVYDPILNTLRKLASLENVTVRPSALNFGDKAPKVAGLHAGSTAEMKDVFRAGQCQAANQGGQCLDCRKCWDEKDLPISYSKH